VEDEPRTGRPKTSQLMVDLVLRVVTKNSTSRMFSCARISYEVGVELAKTPIPGHPKAPSAATVWRILKENGYLAYKRTIKPGLRLADKEARYDWCFKRKDWTLEDWKNVIWTNETSVQLRGVRGKRRVWRKKHEAFNKHVIHQRWKGKMEFMWWSCFSYDKKGPYHIWKAKTKAEHAAIEADLAQRNAAREAQDKEDWDLEYNIGRLGLRNRPVVTPFLT
jgi:hypothetical protein